MPRSLGRLLVGFAWLAALAVIGFIAFAILTPDRPAAPSRPPASDAVRLPSPIVAPTISPPAQPALATGVGADCAAPPSFQAAARLNAASLDTLPWAPFRRPEVGWEVYAPRIASEIGSPCAPSSPAFARALADWQGPHGLPANGEFDAATFAAMNTRWERQRPFERLSETGVCPGPPPPAELASARTDEGYAGKPVQLRPAALAAYRRLVAAARAASPVLAADPRLLTIFSGYRDPRDDAARCDREGNCGNASRARCSAHRTGLAVDLYLGAAPGYPPDTSDDANRLYQSRTPAYGWLIAHAGEFGFVNYPFEPWHWEWTGATP
ncbi:MAG: peptidase and DD-carboxypeptidase VanY/endolysin [Caulobacteraceae bacterium]|nr:peptidase and DD-carboxypeptidase VanY/endolysin [Caulobacteraceae bacterium]